ACFIGHELINRSIYTNLAKKLEKNVDSLIKQGIIYFGCGAFEGFDQLAGMTVLNARKSNPGIRLIIVLPCKQQDFLFSGANTRTYKDLIANADKVVYVTEKFSKNCVDKRNQHLINNSSICVTYMKHIQSNIGQTVRLAQESGLTVINLA
ncbi:MAG: SLOG family protein, partial [Clostridiales bacterium]|nr:SLOG family protein [Clostridiales bacterium]